MAQLLNINSNPAYKRLHHTTAAKLNLVFINVTILHLLGFFFLSPHSDTFQVIRIYCGSMLSFTLGVCMCLILVQGQSCEVFLHVDHKQL